MARILLADDNADLLEIQREVLCDAGHHVTTATTGSEAVKKTRHRVFDLVITDIVMPDGDGIETIVHLRKRHPSTKIIAMSGGGRLGAENYLPVAEKLGAAKAVAKPVTARQLLAMVDQVLGMRGAA
jgi:CheY-like chemotaxis protein